MSDSWTSFDKRMPDPKRLLVVTNNVTARDAHGEYSHAWLTSFLHRNDDGSFMTFDQGDRRIHGLTHWRYAFPENALPTSKEA